MSAQYSTLVRSLLLLCLLTIMIEWTGGFDLGSIGEDFKKVGDSAGDLGKNMYNQTADATKDAWHDVSWLKRRNIHELLTVGLTPYSSDSRFFVEHSRQTQNWALKIRSVKQGDAGVYECQVSTHPPSSVFLQLKIVEAAAVIQGAPDIHVKNGSTLHLVCSLVNSTEPPVFIFWYHGARMINYDKDPNISVRSDASGSVLIIGRARQHHTGNYTCLPSNVRSASVTVHVLIDETPAAMQDGRNNMNQLSFNVFYYYIYLILILCYNRFYVNS